MTGVAFLPMSGGLIVMANLSTVVLMPRFGPKPLVVFGMLAAAGNRWNQMTSARLDGH